MNQLRSPHEKRTWKSKATHLFEGSLHILIRVCSLHMTDSIQAYVQRGRAALDAIRRKREITDKEIQILKDENRRLWETQEKPTSSDGVTVRRRDSLRLRRSSLRLSLSFKEVRNETPREKLQDLETSMSFKTTVRSTLATGTAVDMWVSIERRQLHLLMANAGVAEEIVLDVPVDDWVIVKFWASVKKVRDRK